METGKKKKRYTYNVARLLLFAFIAALIYTLISLANQQGSLAIQIEKQNDLMRKQAELEQQVQYYVNELDYIGTDEYVEQEARNRFGWLMPGEIKYVEGTESVVADTTSSTEPAAVQTADSASSGYAASSEPAGTASPSADPTDAGSAEPELNGAQASGSLTD